MLSILKQNTLSDLRKIVFSCWALFLFVGCASGPVLKNSEIPKSSEFTDFIKSASLSKLKGQGRCLPDLSKVNHWKELVSGANACVLNKKWKSLEIYGRKLAKLNPQSPWGAYYLSLHAEEEGDLERALWMSELSLKKVSGVGVLHFQKGRILWLQDQFENAIVEITKSLSLDPQLFEAHAFLGIIYYQGQDYKKATSHLEMASQVYTDGNTLVALAESYEKMKNLDKALLTYRRVNHQKVKSFDDEVQKRIHSLELTLNPPEVERQVSSQETQPKKGDK